jgi:hypothetical protein
MTDDLEARARRLLAGSLNKRVEIMVSGPVGSARCGKASIWCNGNCWPRPAVAAKVSLRVTAFLDGCRHTTPWSNSPVDAGAATTRWHCFQGETLFAEAFAQSCAERDRIDAIIIFSDRSDDGFETFDFAERLRARGTKILPSMSVITARAAPPITNWRSEMAARPSSCRA